MLGGFDDTKSNENVRELTAKLADCGSSTLVLPYYPPHTYC